MPEVGTTHDIRLSDGTDELFLRLAAGGWRRRPAPLRGARVATGDHSYSDLSLWQHWHQFCWNGGLGADKWVDDAMFDHGVGLDTTIADQVSLSRDLVEVDNTDLTSEALDRPRKFIMYERANQENPRLYCVTLPWAGDSFGSSVFKFNNSTAKWEKVKEFGPDWKATSVAKFSGELVIGFRNGKIRRTTNPVNTSSWKTTNAPKKVKGKAIYAMRRFSGRLYVAYWDRVYRRKSNWKVDGKTEFYNASGSSPVIAMEEHLGYLYMASRNGRIHRTDGNNTFDIWSWDGGTQIKALRSFDGRLFVGTYEFTDDDDLGFNGIYQFTGSAVTQLKRWGTRDRATIMGDFTEYDRKLFYGAANLWGMNKDVGGTDHGGFGVAVFDPIEDAHSIWATNKDTTTYPDSGAGVGKAWIVDDVVFWRGYLHAAVRGHGNFRAGLAYRDYVDGAIEYDTSKQDATGNSNAGFLASSNYDAGTPGLQKLWRDIVLTGRVPENTSVEVYFSIDKGETWTAAGSVTGDVDPAKAEVRVRMDLDDVRSQQIMYRLELDSSDSSVSPTILGVTFSYLPMPEPNWLWDMTVVIAERQELLDSTIEQKTPAQLDADVALMARWYRDQTPLVMTDIDGVIWTGDGPPIKSGVLLWDFNDDYHVPGFEDEPREGAVRFSVIEVQREAA